MKILLVDDSKVTRYALRIELQHLGVEVETAESAESALASLETRLPDAILVDHIMSGLNGLEALEIIRANPRTAHIPVVLITAQEDLQLTESALRKGVLAILPKACASERLPEIVERIHTALASGDPRPPASASPNDAEPSESAVTRRLDPQQEDALTALIDARLEAGLDKRLTALIADLRRDLAEMLTAELDHHLEVRLAEARALDAASPPARPADLAALESRLLDERIPELLMQRVSSELVGLKDALLDELRAAPQPITRLDEPATTPVQAHSEVAPLAHLKQAGGAILDAVRAALRRRAR